MNEKPNQTCPLLTIAAGAAGASRFVSCVGEFCAWYDSANQRCTVQNIEPKE